MIWRIGVLELLECYVLNLKTGFIHYICLSFVEMCSQVHPAQLGVRTVRDDVVF